MGNQPTAVQAPPGLQGEAAFKQYPLNQSEELKTQQNTNVLRDPTQPVSRHSSKQASIPAQTVAFPAQRHQTKLHSIPMQPAAVPQGVTYGAGYPSQTAQPVVTYPPPQQVPQYAAPKQAIRPSQVQQPKRPSTTTQAGVPLKSNLKRTPSIKGPQHTQPAVHGSVTIYSQAVPVTVQRTKAGDPKLQGPIRRPSNATARVRVPLTEASRPTFQQELQEQKPSSPKAADKKTESPTANKTPAQQQQRPETVRSGSSSVSRKKSTDANKDKDKEKDKERRRSSSFRSFTELLGLSPKSPPSEEEDSDTDKEDDSENKKEAYAEGANGKSQQSQMMRSTSPPKSSRSQTKDKLSPTTSKRHSLSPPGNTATNPNRFSGVITTHAPASVLSKFVLPQSTSPSPSPSPLRGSQRGSRAVSPRPLQQVMQSPTIRHSRGPAPVPITVSNVATPTQTGFPAYVPQQEIITPFRWQAPAVRTGGSPARLSSFTIPGPQIGNTQGPPLYTTRAVTNTTPSYPSTTNPVTFRYPPTMPAPPTTFPSHPGFTTMNQVSIPPPAPFSARPYAQPPTFFPHSNRLPPPPVLRSFPSGAPPPAFQHKSPMIPPPWAAPPARPLTRAFSNEARAWPFRGQAAEMGDNMSDDSGDEEESPAFFPQPQQGAMLRHFPPPLMQAPPPLPAMAPPHPFYPPVAPRAAPPLGFAPGGRFYTRAVSI